MGKIDDFEDTEYRKHSLQEGDSECEDISLEDMTLVESIEYDLNQNYKESLFINCMTDSKTLDNLKRLFGTVHDSKIKHSNVIRVACRTVYFNNSEILDKIGYTTDIFIEGKTGNTRITCRLDSQLYDIIDDISDRWLVSKQQVVSFFISIYVDLLTGDKTTEDIKNQFELLLKHSEEHEEERAEDSQYLKLLKRYGV